MPFFIIWDLGLDFPPNKYVTGVALLKKYQPRFTKGTLSSKLKIEKNWED